MSKIKNKYHSSILLITQRIRLIALCSLLFATNSSLFAQHVHVSAKVDSNKILIGDWIHLNINLEYPNNIKISYPQITDSLQGLEIIERKQPEVIRSGNVIKEKYIYVISAFDTGTFVIPSLQFLYNFVDDTEVQTATTSPIPIFVHSIGINTDEDIKDIKPPLSVPITFSELLPYLIGIVVIGLVSFGFYYFIKKRKKGEVWEIFTAPIRPAHEIALNALRSLEAEKLWHRGEVKLYHSKLTDIVRTYIENRFFIRAMESTTDEIIEDFKKTEINGTLKDTLYKMLELGDLVKFAKQQPLPDENERSLKYAYEFVENTMITKTSEEEKV